MPFFGAVMNPESFFKQNNQVAIAFSGGVDSSYLLYAALKYAGRVKAYYVKSQFQPQFELEDALRLAKQLGADIEVINLDVLADSNVVSNPCNRCYFCKKAIFNAITTAALKDDFTLLLDGTNASDDAGDRPGMKALKELNVKSPLREWGLTKADIRSLSKEAGLFTWDKPAYACLATRIKTGEVITKEKLCITETAEAYLSELGFTDFRVRMMGGDAKIQVKADQFEKLFSKRELINKELKKYYRNVMIDMEAR